MTTSARQHRPQANSDSARRAVLARAQRAPERLAVGQALARPAGASASGILQLQRAAGNRAVNRLLAAHGIQASLRVGPADDAYERQANQVAEAVTGPSRDAPASPLGVQRLEDVRASGGRGEAGFELDAGLQSRLDSSRGRGAAMPETLRRSMEGGFGADFGQVRLHTGRNAAELSDAIQAKAFTRGRDIYFAGGQYNPGSQAGQRLLAHELTHVVQQGAAGAAAKGISRSAGLIRRAFGKKKRKKTDQAGDAELQQTGKGPQDALLVVRAAVKTGTKTRGRANLEETLGGGGGHGWLEIDLGPAYASLDDFEKNAPDGDIIGTTMTAATRGELSGKRTTSAGFYPDVQGALNPKTLAKQLFTDVPGKIIEPEQPHFRGNARGTKAFAVTDSIEAITLINFINAHRNRPYNVMRYNCTDFVVGALATIGRSVGNTSNKLGWTMPTKLYKRIYERAALGDKSAGFTDLAPKTNRGGKRMDVKHLSKSAAKKLKKKVGKLAPTQIASEADLLKQRVVAQYSLERFLGIRSGGMLRPGTEVGVTGQIDGDYGEIVVGGAAHWVLLHDFEAAFAEPYPGAKPAVQGGQPGLDDANDQISPQDLQAAEDEAEL
jgi:hypothetical protein